jgi:hypothetical protein
VLTWTRVLLALLLAGLIGAVVGWQLHPDPPPGVDHRCHSFVVDGQIQFLGDCTHKLAGQTVPLPVLV